MDYSHVWVAIIAGGQGTRLFPISHSKRPKQFCNIDSKRTFIQAVIDNFAALGIKKTQMIIITTNDNQSELAKEQAQPRGVLSQNVYQISSEYGYAGAMIKAAEFIKDYDKEAVIINSPADQYLEPGDNFRSTIESAITEAKKSNAVIVGVKVTDIVTAMGCGHAVYREAPGASCHVVESFVEKPDRKNADLLMRAGNSACNTGINVWTAAMILGATADIPIRRLGTDTLMSTLRNGKVAKNVEVAVGDFVWKDCGTLKSLYEISKKTPNHKNASLGSGTFERVDCRRSLLYASEGMELRVTGSEDDAIVFTTINEQPIIVIAKMSESQRIKALAEDYSKHEDFLTDDFSFGARNNIVLRSNVNDLVVGFVGVENYAVYVHRETDGMMVAAVSQQRTK